MFESLNYSFRNPRQKA